MVLMRDEVIIIVAGMAIAAVILTAIGITLLYPNIWGRYDQNPPSDEQIGSRIMGQRMMNGMMGGPGMMALYSADAQPLSEEDARNRVQAYLGRYGSDIRIGDFMEFSLNYYVELKDADDRSIAEILVDRYTGVITPEPGPNIIWNTRYDDQYASSAVEYDLAEGRSQAEKFLAGYLPEATLHESITYPGYYTFDFGRDRIEGMLSVNAYTGDIWVHTWHGQYIGG
jgi:hypothetical protein